LGVHVQVRCAVAAVILLLGHDCLAAGEQPADLADFIVLNQDILRSADQGHADDIRKTAVLETWFMGNPVYVSKGSDPNALKRPN